MSPTKKKTPAPKKAPTRKPAPKTAATKAAKPAKAAAKRVAAKPAPAPASKKAAAPGKEAAKKADKVGKVAEKATAKAVEQASTAKATRAGDAKSTARPEAAAKARPAPARKPEDEAAVSTKRAKPKKPVTPTGPRHPKLGYRWACFRCEVKFYDLGKDEPICPKCAADQRDRPADEPRATAADSARPRVVRPMAQLLDDDEPVAPLAEDDLGLDDVVEAGDMFEGDGDITHLELDAAELEGESIEAGEPDEF